MGLFNKENNGGFMDEIRCDEPSYLIWKWHPKGSQKGENDRENSIRWGSSLRVKEGEEFKIEGYNLEYRYKVYNNRIQYFDEVLEQVKSIKAEDVKESIVKKVNELQKELKDLDKEKALKIAKQKATKIQKKADELYKLAVEKGTPVIEKSVSELKQATADVLKKIVAKLETENK